LWRIGTKHEKTKTGFVSEKAVYSCENCDGCPYRKDCTKAKYNKTVSVSHRFKALREESRRNITAEFGTSAEGVFLMLAKSEILFTKIKKILILVNRCGIIPLKEREPDETY